MKQAKGEPLYKFVQIFREATSTVHIKDEYAIIYAFKIALAIEEKACYKYLSKCKIPQLSRLYYYYEKFWNQQDKLKIREHKLGLDNKQNKKLVEKVE